MVCFHAKEPIMSPMFYYYHGMSEFDFANITMVEGYFFMLGSLLMGFIPERSKNFNKIILVGIFFYFLTMMVGGPILFIQVGK